MSTWQGALVRMEHGDRFRELAGRYRIVVTDTSGPWVLVGVPPQLGKLGPPPFAQSLSNELNTTVIAFFVQTTVSDERIEHWQSGRLVRELEYYMDGGGWIAQSGEPQEWEGAYFFSKNEGTGPNDEWPSNLGDEVSEDDIGRYEEARSKRTAGPVMDLLMGGDVMRLCKFYGVDIAHPGAQYTPAKNWRVLGLVLFTVALFVGALVLGWTAR